MKTILISTAKNEGPYIWEWVAHHLMLGFDDIAIFQNDSDDFTHEILMVLREAGLVQYFYNRAETGRHQVRAYRRSARIPQYKVADWAIALDLDEFLVVKTGENRVQDLIAAMPDADQIFINWLAFGSSGLREISSDPLEEPVSLRYTMSEDPEAVRHRFRPVKTLFRRKKFHCPGVHLPQGSDEKARLRNYNGSGLLEGAYERKRFRVKDPNNRALAQINHYITRDAASFVLKSAKGSAHQANRDIGRKYWSRRNLNTSPNGEIFRYAAQLRAKMIEIDAATQGQLLALTREAMEQHRKRFAQLMEEPDYAALYEFCCTNPRLGIGFHDE